MAARDRQSLSDDIANSSQFMISTPQPQLKLLENKVKSKSEAVFKNLNVLRKIEIAKTYDVFEREKFNDYKYQEQEINETLRYEGQEDGRIHQSIKNNNSTREHLIARQAVIEKCMKNSSTQRIEHQLKTSNGLSKKYEEFLSKCVQFKEESQNEDAKARGELEGIETEIADIENGNSDVEKEISVMEQTDKDIDLELENYENQVDLYKANEKELKKIKIDLESNTKELEEKNEFAAKQETSIADINGTKKDLIDECEELTVKKAELQDNLQQLEIKMEQFSTLLLQVNNKAEIFRLESDDKFLCILASDEYVESKLKLESIMKDNTTLMNELELLHKCDELLTTSTNDNKRELKLNSEVLAEMEIKKQSFEEDLRIENENLKQGLLKAQEEDKKMIRIIQKLQNEAENLRMEELYGQEAFNANKIQWNHKFKEELNKLNELKNKASSVDITATDQAQASEATSSNNHSRSRNEKGGNINRYLSTNIKRKSNSVSSVQSAKQMKQIPQIIEQDDTDDEDNEFNITFNTDTEL